MALAVASVASKQSNNPPHSLGNSCGCCHIIFRATNFSNISVSTAESPKLASVFEVDVLMCFETDKAEFGILQPPATSLYAAAWQVEHHVVHQEQEYV